MIPEWSRYFEVVGALTTLAGLLDWTRRGSAAEDEMMVEYGDLLLDGACNADLVSVADCRNDVVAREMVTVEQVEALREETELRRWGWGRN